MNFDSRYSGVGLGSSSCSYQVEGKWGTILTPRFFANNTCSWLITAPVNHTIILTFETFQLYYKDEIGRQIETRLQVWDGVDDKSNSLGIFRGTKRSFFLNSSDRHLFLRLFLDTDVLLCNFEGSFISTTTAGKEQTANLTSCCYIKTLKYHALVPYQFTTQI